MSDKMLQELLARLDALAAKLGVTGEYLWGVLVRQARVEVLSWGIILAFGALLAALMVWVIILARKADREGKDEKRDALIWVAILSGAAALLIWAKGICSILTPWLNPEYWAFQEFLKQLR